MSCIDPVIDVSIKNDTIIKKYSPMFTSWFIELSCIYKIKEMFGSFDDIEKYGFAYYKQILHDGTIIMKRYKPFFPNFSRYSIDKYVLQMIDIMKNLRKCGIFHNDFHSENILMSDDEKIIMIDFGNALRISIDGKQRMPFPSEEIFYGLSGISQDYIMRERYDLFFGENKISCEELQDDPDKQNIAIFIIWLVAFLHGYEKDLTDVLFVSKPTLKNLESNTKYTKFIIKFKEMNKDLYNAYEMCYDKQKTMNDIENFINIRCNIMQNYKLDALHQ